MAQKIFTTESAEETVKLGESIGVRLRGGEVIELKSDLGGGKTTLTRGLAQGFGSADPVASPSFTINYVYGREDGGQLWHFDFYRLTEPGVIANELAEAQSDPQNVIVVEWGEIVEQILPKNRTTITITSLSETDRKISCDYAEGSFYLFDGVSV